MSKNTCFSRTNRHHAEQPATIISVQYSHVDDPKCPDSITRQYRCTATAVPSLICRRVARASHASCSHHSRPDGQGGWEGDDRFDRARPSPAHGVQTPSESKAIQPGPCMASCRASSPASRDERQEAAGAALLLPTLPPACDDDVVVYSRR